MTLRRTSHGVAHVTADDLYGVGYGVAYAYTEDNLCLLAHRVAEVQGKLSAQLGADTPVNIPVHAISLPSIDSDRFYRGWYDTSALEASFEAGSVEVRDLARGYADGVNRYLADHPDRAPCAVEFVEDLTPSVVYRMWVATAGVASGELLEAFLAQAPPSSASRRSQPPALGLEPIDFGSNAWAIGREGTVDGGSVHLYNPHFPWEGIHRLYLVHVTVPGDIDVFGATLGGFPLPFAGFDERIAWGLTFSTAARFTVHRLPLVAGDPMSYVVDGQTHAITEEVFDIEVAGESAPRQVSFFRSEQGPILDAGSYLMGWSPSAAYAVHDVNADNTFIVEQLLGIARANDVSELKETLSEIRGMPWSYVTASDADGSVLFGELSRIPAVTAEQIEDCQTPVSNLLQSFGIFVVDGGRAACDWTEILAAADLPYTIRADYVANSNNTYELPNLAQRLEGATPILGAAGEPLDLRPSLGLAMIEERLSGTDGLPGQGFSRELAQQVFFERRNRAAELLADEIAADCLSNPVGASGGAELDLTEVCQALSAWDHTNRVDSPGAAVFAGLWETLVSLGMTEALFAAPASLDDPIGTPSGYTSSEQTRASVRDALAGVAETLAAAGISPDALWGEAHLVQGPGGLVALPGGSGTEGVFDALTSIGGWSEALYGAQPERLYGAGYLHAVSLGTDGVSAYGILAYGQSTEPSSPWYYETLDEYASDEWHLLPYLESDIEADPELVTSEL